MVVWLSSGPCATDCCYQGDPRCTHSIAHNQSNLSALIEEVRKNMLPIDINRLMRVLSDILSDKYDMNITLTARKKEESQ